MSYYYDEEYRRLEEAAKSARSSSWYYGLFLLVGGFALLGIGLFMLPDLRRQWLETDPHFILQMRQIEARAAADAAFRKREAELLAESHQAADKLDHVSIPPSPLRAVVARTSPSVVSITASSKMRQEDLEGGRGRNWNLPPGFEFDVPRAEGSGVIVKLTEDKQAFVLTNSHVVGNADKLDITLQSGRTVQAKKERVYTDPLTDLALIEFDAATLDHVAVAEFGNSDEVEAGDWVVAIGSPFGLQQSVTFGIVSAKGRVNPQVVEEAELIQTDVAINPGNSGGPLLDLQGRIIGISTFIFTRNGGNQGVGFAVPSNTAQMVAEQLMKPPHQVRRGFMGVMMGVLTEEQLAKLGIEGGVLVKMVQPTLPAAEAGMKPGDIILRFDRKPVKTAYELRKLVMRTEPQTTVTVEILRHEEGEYTPRTMRVTLSDKPLELPRMERP